MRSYQSIDRERAADQAQVENFLCGLVIATGKLFFLLLGGGFLIWLICEKQVITPNRPTFQQSRKEVMPH
jgi:hypothetical protein